MLFNLRNIHLQKVGFSVEPVHMFVMPFLNTPRVVFCCPDRLVMRWRFSDRIKQQMSAFMSGFSEFIPQDLVRIFDENEVEVW